jgi:ABC-type branched-subunit amino acid transport system substrate-binding protein
MGLIRSILLGIMIIGGLISCSKNIPSQKDKKEIVKIGVIAPLSGNSGFVGEGMRNAILLAKENAKPQKFEYQFIFEDDQKNISKSVQAAHKLIDIDHVDALISVFAGTGKAIAPIAEKGKKVHIGISIDPIAGQGKYNFIHYEPPQAFSSKWKEELRKRNLNKIALYVQNEQAPLVFAQGVIEKQPDEKHEIVYLAHFNTGERDFRGMISAAIKQKPEVHVVFSYSPEMDVFFQQLKEAQVKVPITGFLYVSENKKPIEGWWFVGPKNPSIAFQKTYEERFGKTCAAFSGNAYNMAKWLMEYYEKSPTSEKPNSDWIVEQFLKTEKFEGVFDDIKLLPQHFISCGVEAQTIKNGMIQPLESK